MKYSLYKTGIPHAQSNTITENPKWFLILGEILHKLRNITFTLICLSGLSITEAHAGDSAAFSGIDINTGLGLSGNLSKTTGSYNYTNLFGGAADAAANSSKTAQAEFDTRVVPSLSLGYSLPVNDSAFVRINATAFFNNGKTAVNSGDYTFPNPNNRSDALLGYNVTTTVDTKSHFAIGIEPGYAFTDALAGFFSLSYHNLRADLSTKSGYDHSNQNAAAFTTDSTESKTFHGIGIGVGGKYLLTENWEIGAQAEYVYYSSANLNNVKFTSTLDEIHLNQSVKINPSSADLRVTLGYKF
ncbi:MAG TPA: hypothetical protein VM661_11570 [Candidatus Sulfotelmatobacter sp.]|jgi:outer membrane protein W|nr:hypothetical protein [Candidatus Sulfotelmatobacter sp.]